jgi:hypothetical protein
MAGPKNREGSLDEFGFVGQGGMSFEHKIVVSLDEIKAIIFECNECNAKIAMSPGTIERPPIACPRGHAWDWDTPDEFDPSLSPFVSFIKLLKGTRNSVSQGVGFRILLELEEPRLNDAASWSPSKNYER